MGTFNTLITDTICNNCQNTFQLKLQFKFGDTWQYIYQTGDTLKWGGNDIGSDDLLKVKVYGIAENNVCIFCKHPNPEEFDINIQHNIILSINPISNIDHYHQDINFSVK